MPVDYQLPPWLHPQDTVGPYAAGLRQSQQLAQQLQLQREHLSHQAVLAQMEAQIKQDQAEKENILAQQRIQVGAAYQQQEVALKQQEIEQGQQKLQMATQEAARKHVAMAALQQALGGAKTPEEQTRAILQFGPQISGSLTGLGSVMRAGQINSQDNIPQVMELPGTGGRQIVRNPRTGSFQLLDRDQQVQNRQMALERVRAGRAELKAQQLAHDKNPIRFVDNLPEKEKSDQDRKAIAAWKQEQDGINQRQADLNRMMAPQQGGGGGATTDQTAAAPSNRLRWNPELGVAEPIPQNPDEDEANLEPVQQ